MCTPGEGGCKCHPFKLPRPLIRATPSYKGHAHKVFSMIIVDFCIDRSRIGLLGSKEDEVFVGVALALWA